MNRWTISITTFACSLATIGCGPPQLSSNHSGSAVADETDATDTGGSSTTDPSDTESTGEESTTPSFVVEPDVFEPFACDPFAQDCPEGEKCVPYGGLCSLPA